MIDPIDNVQFIGRVEENSYNVKSLVEASSENIVINPMYFLKSKAHFITKKKAIREFFEKNINKTDIVIIRLPSEVGYIAADYLEARSIPYGIELVGDPWDALWYHGSPLGKFRAFSSKRKVKKHMYKSHNNIYVTNRYLQKKYPSSGNSFVASNVVIEKVRNNYRNNKNTIKKIGMIGSLDTKYKGIETALKSLARVKNDFLFEIVGNGPKEKWENKIHEYGLEGKVILKGTKRSGDEINSWLSSLDLYIQPSYTEGLPRALIEAMSNGVPCLGSEAGGIPELLETNYIHKIKDYKQFAKQIDKVLESDELRKEMSKTNSLMAQNYLNEKIQNEREKFVKSIYEEHQEYES
jgi:glycosyltransferase involved in cell wall biosynthesis